MKKKNNKRRMVMMASVGLMAFSSLAGCIPEPQPSGAQKTGDKAGTADSGAPFTITMTYNFDGKEYPKPGNEVLTALEKLTNTKLQLTGMAGTPFGEKLPVMIASGDLNMVVASAGSLKQSYIVDAVRGDVFWELSPYLKDYPALNSINPIIYKNVSVDGKIIGLPRIRPLARGAFIYRKDWLNNLGMKEPKTIEEYYEMLKAFKEKDPDKNGKNDTYGLTTNSVGNYGVFFGAPNNWDQKDGKFIKDVLTPEYLEGLKFEKRLYDEGLLNKDFAAIDRPKWEGEFEFGKAGVILNTSNTVVAFGERAKKQDPNGKGESDFFSRLTGPKGERVAAATGANGVLMFPKSSVKTEADLKHILKFFNQLSDEPVASLLEWGIEGKHFEKKDGKATRTNQESYDNEVGFPYKLPLGIVPSEKHAMSGNVHPMKTKETTVTTENEKFAVSDPTIYLISETAVEKGSQLDLIIKDANIKFVMGNIDEAGWKAEVEKWRKNGGDKSAEEYAATFAKQKK